MKIVKIGIAIIFASVLFIGCGGSSSSMYRVKPTPIEKGLSTYSLQSLKVNLSHGANWNEESNKIFITQEQLEKSFKDFILKYMNKEKLYSEEGKFLIDISIDYKRIYNMGGKALNKPEFIYTIKILDQRGKLLVNYTIPKSTTSFGTLKDMAVNAEIAIFKWGVEDEPKDIELISKTLVKELKKIGR